jgi:hypothetical protein
LSNPTKKCSIGTKPEERNNVIISSCTIPYVPCNKKSDNPANTSGACCGTTNIQGNQCNGVCTLAGFGTGPAGQTPPLSDIPVRIYDTAGKTNIYTKTDSNGTIYVELPYAQGRKTSYNEYEYIIEATAPSDKPFTRGMYFRVNSKNKYIPKQTKGPGGEAKFTNVKSGKYCDDGDCNNFYNQFVSFGFSAPPTGPWIKTTGGDVHSNTGINTPGGP